MHPLLDAMQWPAMAVTILAAYLVASKTRRLRYVGFWTFLASNVLWIVWGLHASAYAVVVLQLFLGGTNVRGLAKNKQPSRADAASG